MLRRGAVLAAVLLGCGLSGCASLHTTDLSTLPPMPKKASVAGVPFYPQKEKYCGPASLAMAVTWAGKPVTQDDVAALTFTPGRDGTFRTDIQTAAYRYGRLAVRLRNLQSVLKEVAAGRPVIVFQNLGLSIWHVWHYAVLVGYDLNHKEVILNSGKDKNEILGIKLFERTWNRADNWALAVLPPGMLPVDARESDVLDAAAGLERVKSYKAAASAYRAIVGRWPMDWAAYFGLGNVRFAEKQFAAAEQAYRHALAIKPDEAGVWNNLAYALARQGRKTDAIEAARRAVAAAPDDKAAYKQTLAELSGQTPPP
ncbi:MAG TPA: PA2778 family cysteine peptidase [Alphaproteobacteria bacterium]|nr:PA2778 family cysteine peptidase [Alphaproteobacteria bacterium]